MRGAPSPLSALALTALTGIAMLDAGVGPQDASSAARQAAGPDPPAVAALARPVAELGPHPDRSALGRLPAPPLEPPPASHQPLVFPVAGSYGYGEHVGRFGVDRGGHVHQGQDVFAPTGTPLLAVTDSDVLQTGSDGGRGNYLILRDRHVDRTYHYFHMAEPAHVDAGQAVLAGDRVGSVGCTGRCLGPHLHLEVHRGTQAVGEPVDPLPRMRRWAQRTSGPR